MAPGNYYGNVVALVVRIKTANILDNRGKQGVPNWAGLKLRLPALAGKTHHAFFVNVDGTWNVPS